MSTLISAANGNLTGAATWGLVDPTSFLNSENGATLLTTSMVASSAFTPGAITVDGVAVKVSDRAAVPSGTMTVEIALAGVRVTGAFCTVNVADLSLCTQADAAGGWLFLKFAAPVTFAAATAYTVRALTSVASMVNLFRDSTAANWSRALRTTTTQAPVAGDNMMVLGELTGAGTGNSLTVTMDSTAATDYGANVIGTPGLVAPALAIGKRGTLTWGTAAATNYLLRLSGSLVVYAGGTHNVGTIATPIPRGSTAWLEFDCAADGDFQLRNRNLAIYNHQGLSRTAGKDVVGCKLTANAAANATSLNVDTDTGWKDNDAIAIASTSRTFTECENGLLNGDAGTTSMTVDGFLGTAGGLHFAHGGVDPVVAEVILLTRNTGVRAVSSSFYFNIYCGPTAQVDIDWAEFYYLNMASSQFPGFDIQTTTGSFSLRYFSIHDCGFTKGGTVIQISGAASDNWTVQHGGIYSAGNQFFQNATTTATGVNCLFDDVWMILGRNSGSSSSFAIVDLGGTFSNLVLAGHGNGGIFCDRIAAKAATVVSNITIHSMGSTGWGTFSPKYLTINGLKIWRCASSATNNNAVGAVDCRIINYVAFGNLNYNFGTASGRVWLDNPLLAGDTTFPTLAGINGAGSVIVNGGSIGVATGIYAAHTTSDLIVSTPTALDCYFNGVSFGAATLLTFTGGTGARDNLQNGTAIHIQRMNGTSGSHQTISRDGVISLDAATFHTAAPSQRLTPAIIAAVAAAGIRFQSAPETVAVNSGDSKTLGVWVLKDATYGGSQPRLMQRGNAAAVAGMTADVVLATMSAGAGTWQQLSATIGPALDNTGFELYVDCDGATGFINIDEWAQA